MMNLSQLLQVALPYGLLLSLLMGVVFIALAYMNPEIWLKDYPPDIQAQYGPAGERARRQRKLAGIPVLVFMLGSIGLAIGRLAQVKGSPLVFGDVFVVTFAILLIFNLIDLLILDWLFFVTLQPRIVVLPGTEGAGGYRDYGFHLRASLKGIVGSALAAVIAAVVVLLLQTLLR